MLPVAFKSFTTFCAGYCMFPLIALALIGWSIARRLPVALVLVMWSCIGASFVAALSIPDSWIERRYFDYRYGKLADVAREIAEGRDANEDLARRCGAHSIEVSVVANDVRIVTFWFPSGMTLLETELYLTSDRKLLPSGRQPVRTDDLGSWYLSDRYD